MRKSVLFIVFTVVLLIAPLAGSYIGDTSPGALVVYPPPATGAFAYNTFLPPNTPGFSYVDPVFGETVRRLTTDHVYDDIYARNMWWNADETRYLHRTNGPGGFADFWDVIDVATGAVTHDQIPNGMIASDGGFDPVDPNVLYSLQSDGIHRITLGTGGTWNDALYFAPPSGATLASLGGTLNWLDASGRYMLVRYGPEPSVRLYDRQNPAVPYANPINMSNYNYLGLSPDGRFIVGYQDPPAGFWGIGQGVSWRIDHASRTIPTTPNAFWSLCGDHGSFLSASDGRDYMIVSACGDNPPGIWRVDITNNANVCGPGGTDPCNEAQQRALPNNRAVLESSWEEFGHASTVARGDWAFVSTEDDASFVDPPDAFDSGSDDGTGHIGPWHSYRQEIVAFNVVTGEIRRLAHHRSRFFSSCPAPPDPGAETCSISQYYSTPRVSASWSGKVVGFASNFNQHVGWASTVDIFAIPFTPGTPPGPTTENVTWTNLADVTATGNTIQKTAGCDG